jgi:hypothetical protein
LKRATELAPDSADAAEALGMALAEFGDPADAIAALKRAAQARGRTTTTTNCRHARRRLFFLSKKILIAFSTYTVAHNSLSVTVIWLLREPSSTLRPNEGYEKFMYLGQLLDDGVAAATWWGLYELRVQINP